MQNIDIIYLRSKSERGSIGMNKYIRKLGFRSSDDMERKITIKAVKWSWVYMMAFLAVWSVLYAISRNEVPIVQITLILTGELLFFALQWFFTKNEISKSRDRHADGKRITSENDKHKYEYVYEDEDGTQYVYEEVEE